MIQDIVPGTFSNVWGVHAPQAEDVVWCFRGRDVLLNDQGHPPRYGQLTGMNGLDGVEYRFLFEADGHCCFLAMTDKVELEGYSYRIARSMRKSKPMSRALAGFTAMHLNNWYRANRFCGRCGSPMLPGTNERKMVCPHCGNLVYPRLNPAVIVAVTDGDRLLMTRYNQWTHSVHHYVLIAGFVEIGETAEQTVEREVMEEAGIRVKNIRYFGSQPWGCDGNLTLGYFAELDGDDHVAVDYEELSDARWFHRSQVPVPDDDVSITSEMIHRFAAGRERERLK